jgi:citrate synthase
LAPEFVTKVSSVEPGRVLIRGYSHEEVMRTLPFAEAALLTIVGRLPNRREGRLVGAMLVSLLDHGFVAATVSAARYLASGNPEVVPAMAGGLLAAGRNTLSPEHSYQLIRAGLTIHEDRGLSIEQAAETVVAERRGARQRIPGLGHPIHKSADFRAEVLFQLSDELGLSGPAVAMLRAIHRAVATQAGRTDLPINIDGCLAALSMDLGISARQVTALALIAVMPGLAAHVIEEIEEGRPLRYVEGRYDGEPYRPLPVGEES